MTRLLVVEDQPKDRLVASEAAILAGFTLVESKHSASTAKLWLEGGLNGKGQLPDAIVLDLDLGMDSGFDLMRFWHETPQLRTIPIVVWTNLDDHFGRLCTLFTVKEVVPKWQGKEALLQALSRIATVA